MAIIKYTNKAGQYRDDLAREQLLTYMMNPQKTPHHYYGGKSVDMDDPTGSMQRIAESYHKDSGTRIHQFVITFANKDSVTATKANAAAMNICNAIGLRYQVVYAVHEDKLLPHIHLAINSVSHINGLKFRADNETKKWIERTCRENLSYYGVRDTYMRR